MAKKFDIRNMRGGIGSLFAGIVQLIWFVGDTFFAGAETLTSSWVRCDAYAKIVGAAYSDVAGTLKVQFSTTGVANEVDSESAGIAVPAAGSGVGFSEAVKAEYFRLTYTNGGAAQAAFRCKAYGQSAS
jgi:hypothetical protein